MSIESERDFEGIIQAAVAETFENLAFEEAVLVEMPGNPRSSVAGRLPGRFPDPVSWATIVVLNPPIGTIGLFLPFSLAQHFAEAIYSLPADKISRPVILDNLGELMNTLAGRLLANRLPPETPFRLDFPNFGTDLVMAPDLGPIRAMVFLIAGQEVFLVLPEKYWSL